MKPGGTGRPRLRHLGEARALAAEQIVHAGAAGGLAAAERIDPFALAPLAVALSSRRRSLAGADFARAGCRDFFTGWRVFFERDLAMSFVALDCGGGLYAGTPMSMHD